MRTGIMFSCLVVVTTYSLIAQGTTGHQKKNRHVVAHTARKSCVVRKLPRRYPVYPQTEHDVELLEALEHRDCLAAKQALFKGANPNVTTKYDNTALHLATLFKYSDLATILLNIKKTQVNSVNQDGDTALYLAVLYERYEILKLLLAHHEVDVNYPHPLDQETVLHLAVLKGDPHSLTMLLQHPQINSNAADKFGNTPLHVAARHDQLFAIEILLQRGADKTIKNKRGLTACDIARNQAVIQALG